MSTATRTITACPPGSGRKSTVLAAGILMIVTFVAGCAGSDDTTDPLPADEMPNLVFVFDDQHSWDMMGAYGNDQIITPNLDRFAEQGIRFTHAISNAPQCTPHRGMLLTGQHPFDSGALWNDLRALPGNGDYLAEVLTRAGYRTGYYGKWHLYGGDRNRPVPPGPYRYGFDDEFLTNNTTLEFEADKAYYWDEEGEKQLYGAWESDAQTAQAIQFVDDHADKPFALFISWHPPHGFGGSPPEDMMDLYDPDTLTLRPNVHDAPNVRKMYQRHMAMVTSIDRAFGRLMDKLREEGLEENTIVVFTSDHGDMLRSHGWGKPKQRPEQESIRVPLIVRWPDRLQPRVSDLLVGVLDLAPTLLGLMDLPVPKSYDGRDLAEPILQKDDNAVASVPLFFFQLDWRGVYTHRYTYAFDVSDEERKSDLMRSMDWNVLYDRELDPAETRNLYGDPRYADVQERLHAAALRWMERFGDKGYTQEEIADAVLQPGGEEGVLEGRPSDLLSSR